MKRFTAILLVALVLGGATALAQQQTLAIGTMPAGTNYHDVAKAMRDVLSDAGLPVAVLSLGGSAVTLRMLSEGVGITFATDFAPSSVQAWRGPRFRIAEDVENPYSYSPDIRLLMIIGEVKNVFMVRADSEISSIADLRGKRVVWGFPQSPLTFQLILAGLRRAGLGERDITPVNVASIGVAAMALISGSVDAATNSLGSPASLRLYQSGGIKYVSFDCSPAGIEWMKRNFKGFTPILVKAGSDPTVTQEDVCALSFPAYLVANANLPEPTVLGVLAALWNGSQHLSAKARALRDWQRRDMVDPAPLIPYHPAAVKFFQGKGLWSPGLEARQQELSVVQ